MANRSGHPFEHDDVETLTAARTLTAKDSGKVFKTGAADVVVTLPTVAPELKGVTYTFFVETLSVTTGLSISPAAADQIKMKGITAADNKDIINSAATDAIGDSLTIVCDGADWIVTSFLGTFEREA